MQIPTPSPQPIHSHLWSKPHHFAPGGLLHYLTCIQTSTLVPTLNTIASDHNVSRAYDFSTQNPRIASQSKVFMMIYTMRYMVWPSLSFFLASTPYPFAHWCLAMLLSLLHLLLPQWLCAFCSLCLQCPALDILRGLIQCSNIIWSVKPCLNAVF